MPSPPTWLTEASLKFLEYVAEPMYWLLVIVSILAYMILRWQKRPRETRAAQALRWFTASKVVLWLAFAVGEASGEWRIVLFAFSAVYVGLAGIWWLIALYLTYVTPALRHQRVTNGVLPPYQGPNRRVGPPERRQETLPPKPS